MGIEDKPLLLPTVDVSTVYLKVIKGEIEQLRDEARNVNGLSTINYVPILAPVSSSSSS